MNCASTLRQAPFDRLRVNGRVFRYRSKRLGRASARPSARLFAPSTVSSGRFHANTQCPEDDRVNDYHRYQRDDDDKNRPQGRGVIEALPNGNHHTHQLPQECQERELPRQLRVRRRDILNNPGVCANPVPRANCPQSASVSSVFNKVVPMIQAIKAHTAQDTTPRTAPKASPRPQVALSVQHSAHGRQRRQQSPLR